MVLWFSSWAVLGVALASARGPPGAVAASSPGRPLAGAEKGLPSRVRRAPVGFADPLAVTTSCLCPASRVFGFTTSILKFRNKEPAS